MYAITALAAYTVAVALERCFWLFLRWRHPVDTLLSAMAGDDDAAVLAAAGDGPLGEVARVGLGASSAEEGWDVMGVAAVEGERLFRTRVGSLLVIGNISTMLGLVGTVYGLMIAFSALGDATSGERAVRLSEGISIAMATTAAGLLVGIAAIAVHAALESVVERRIADLEALAGRVAARVRRR